MKILCDNCGTKYSISDDKVKGKVFKIKCKKCQTIIVAHAQSDEAPAAEPAPPAQAHEYDYPAASAAAAHGPEPIWHIVVNGEQVGPLPVPELQARWGRGDITGETFAWREGFAEWLAISQIDELAFLASGIGVPGAEGEGRTVAQRPPATAAPAPDPFAQAPSEGPGDLFGSPPAPAAGPAPSEVFSSAPPEPEPAPAPISAKPAGRRSLSKEELFESDDSASRGGGGGSADLGLGAVDKMTGQRNENSVLFSLSNLQSLQAEGPKASGGGGGGGAGGGFSSSTGGSEGSGLIDIRAMASLALGKAKETGGRPTANDDIPVFGGDTFAPAAGQLLAPSQSSPNKMVYLMMGGVGLLALVAIALVVLVVAGNKKTTVVAPAEKTGVTAPGATAADAGPAAVAEVAADAGTQVAVAGGGGGGVKPPGGGGTVKPPGGGSVRPPGGGGGVKPPPGGGGSGGVVKPPPPPPPPPPPGGGGAKKPDDVQCMLNPNLAGCPQGNKPPPPPPGGGNASACDASQIKAAMSAVNGRVMGCFAKYKIAGTFKVKVVVSGGSVSSVTVLGTFAGTPTGDCVSSAVQAAKFSGCTTSTFNYPYTFK